MWLAAAKTNTMSRSELSKEDQIVKVSVEKMEGSMVSLEVEAPAEVVEEALEKAYRSLVKRVTVPGFRRGKAPRHLLERYVGKEAMADEAIRETLPRLYDQAIEEAKIEPVDDPEFDDIHFEKGEPLKFKAKVYVRPEVDLGDYKSISIPFETPTLTDEEVDRQFELLRERMADLRPLAEDTELAKGHYVTCHVKGIEGEDVRADIDQDLAYIEVGREIPLVPGLGEALIGMKKGETKEFTGVYKTKAEKADSGEESEAAKEASETPAEDAGAKAAPDSDAAPANAKEAETSMTAKFSVAVKEVYEKHVPDDEEVLKNMNKATLDEAKKEIRERVMAMRLDMARKQYTDKVEDALIEKATLDIPRPMILQKAEDILHRFADRLREAGTDINRYLASSGRSAEELRADIERQAEQEVRRDLVLDALAEKEEIQVPQETIDRVVEALAIEAGREVGAVRTTLQLRGAMKSIERDLARVEVVRKLAEEVALRAGTPLPAEEVKTADAAEKGQQQAEGAEPEASEGAAEQATAEATAAEPATAEPSADEPATEPETAEEPKP